ncbi:hypothetical protein L3Q82_012887 [Scortum barcoo]|uniref:Uncharacterized protein n=1 Tax=Scortum barcoo TaxID=214431 RepID=A0ACB8VZN0_9TELE|nr:hypothetical protein L3Q82_012887 [Scortum barcoo]
MDTQHTRLRRYWTFGAGVVATNIWLIGRGSQSKTLPYSMSLWDIRYFMNLKEAKGKVLSALMVRCLKQTDAAAQVPTTLESSPVLGKAGEVFSLRTFILGFKYNKTQKDKCQMILGQSKMAVYMSRKRKVEDGVDSDIVRSQRRDEYGGGEEFLRSWSSSKPAETSCHPSSAHMSELRTGVKRRVEQVDEVDHGEPLSENRCVQAELQGRSAPEKKNKSRTEAALRHPSVSVDHLQRENRAAGAPVGPPSTPREMPSPEEVNASSGPPSLPRLLRYHLIVMKVLKQIPLGDLRPDETVRANAGSSPAVSAAPPGHPDLLPQLPGERRLLHRHRVLPAGTVFSLRLSSPLMKLPAFISSLPPARGKFSSNTSFDGDPPLDRDLDCKLEEVRRSGQSLPELQVIDWFIQLLLGLHYMHDRRILHRDLKAKNVFLKQNLVKIGDFGVSCLLMGSCDLATTFTGTPYYMSPEVLNHQGYNSKSDIWALGCLLYEMCSLTHAFQGPNFLSVVMNIVEGETPTLPPGYSQDLNSVVQRMLQKQPTSRPSAAELLKTEFMEDNMKKMKDRFVFESSDGKKDAELIAKNMQTKVHLQTLMEKSEVEKMTPRERMRLRCKLQAADFRRPRDSGLHCFPACFALTGHSAGGWKLAEQKYEEIHSRRRELRSRHFEKVSLDVLKESREDGARQPVSIQDHPSAGGSQPIRTQDDSMMSELRGEKHVEKHSHGLDFTYFVHILVKREFLLLHHDGPVHRPHNCGRCTNPPVNLTLDLSLTREQDPEILELLHLRQDLSTHLERACHPFPVENHGLGFGGADSHPSRFTLGCKPLQYMLKGNSPAGVQHALGTGLTYYCRQCNEPSSCSGRTETEQPLAKAPGPHTHTEHSPTEYHEGHGRMPSPDPQSTCGLVGQTPINPQAPCGGYRAGPVFHDQTRTKTALFLLNPRVRLSAEFSSPVPWPQKSNNRTPLRVQIGEAVPPDHAPPGITVAHLPTHKQQQETYPQPEGAGKRPSRSHRGELQHMAAAELGSYKQAHTSSPPLTLGNSRVVEGPAPLKELGSRAQAMRGGPPPRLLPKPHCTGPSWTFLRVVSLLEGGPTSPFRAEPGRVPWAKTRPPGALACEPQPKQAWLQGGAPGIPEDPQAAEVYYNQDGFDSCSEDEETTPETLYLSDPQVSELEAMMKHMQKVLEEDLSGDPAEPEAPQSPRGPSVINSSLLQTRIQHLRESVCGRLGSDVFQKLYEELRGRRDGGDGITEPLKHPEEKPDNVFQVDQLLFYEEELQRVRRLQEDRPPV